ncbi:MAG: hypothetical protein WA962_01160 [Ornithinimicrobium sp.]
MKILKATYNQEYPYWVACIGPDTRVYAYISKTNLFHYSHALDLDYYWDMDMDYVTIEPSEAVDLINSGIGQLDESKAWVVERLIASEWSLSADEVLGEAAGGIHRDGA